MWGFVRALFFQPKVLGRLNLRPEDVDYRMIVLYRDVKDVDAFFLLMDRVQLLQDRIDLMKSECKLVDDRKAFLSKVFSGRNRLEVDFDG